MKESYTYIKNAKIIDSTLSGAKYGDILIKNAENGAFIEQMGDVTLPVSAKISVTDAKGAFACPGFADLRAHFCNIGAKPDITAVDSAARAGGFSTVVISPDAVFGFGEKNPDFFTKSQTKTEFLYLAHLTVGGAGQKLADLDAISKGARGFYDDGKTDLCLLREGMRKCSEAGVTLFVNCREPSFAGGVMSEGERARQMKMRGIPALSQELALAKYLMLAKDTGCKLHVHLVSTGGMVDMIRQAKRDGISVTCDTCPQYFSLTDDQVLFKGSVAKVNPPLRGIEDVMAVIEGVSDGTVDAISTDHTPCDKILKGKHISEAPFGMVMLESAFLIGLTNLVEKGHITVYRLIDALCFAPLRILDLEIEGTSGINLFSVTSETYASKNMFVGGYTNSPFEGWHFSGKLIKYFPCKGQNR